MTTAALPSLRTALALVGAVGTGAVGIIILCSTPARAETTAQTPSMASTPAANPERLRLADGEILVDSAGDEITIRAVIDTTPARVWDIIADCEHYAGIMPHMKSSSAIEKEPGVKECSAVASLPLPLPDLHWTVRAVHSVEGNVFRRRWSLVSGDYDKNDGEWTIAPFDDAGTRALVTYRIAAIPKLPVPRSMVRAAQRKNLPDVMVALRKKLVKPR